MLLIKGAYQSANLVNFHMSSQNSEIWILMGSFLSKKHELWAKKSMQGLHFMTLKIDAKFEKKLTSGLQNCVKPFSPDHSNIWKFAFWWATFVESI